MTTPGPVSPDSSKGSQIARGVAVGILQLIFMNLIFWTIYPSISTVFIFLGGFGTILMFAILFLPLILEFIFWRKEYKYFVQGAFIGSVLVPLVGYGLCFLLVGGFR